MASRASLAVAAALLLLAAAGGATAQRVTGPIRHVVLLMQENRSFDHMLGWLRRENPEIDGVNGTEYNLLDPFDETSERIYVTNQAQYITDPDPGHGVGDVLEQAYGDEAASTAQEPVMNGFVINYERKHRGRGRDVMDCFDPEALPVSSTLAREFAVFDKWYCSHPGPTMPNRYYAMSATSNGLATNDVLPIILGFPQRSIFRALNDAGHDWVSYFLEAPTPLVFKDVRRQDARGKFHHLNDFFEHVKVGNLPVFTHIDPRYGYLPFNPPNDDHPDHDVSLGQQLMKDVYEALRASPIWESTLFIITYDEHGGFFDHVPIPTRGVPNPDGLESENPPCKFDYLGPRVPTIMISPWIPRGTVVHEPTGPFPDSQYDHASIPATLKKMFNTDEFLTRRDEWAGTFEHLWANVTAPRTDTPLTLPPVVSLGHRKLITGQELQSGLQREITEIAAAVNGELLPARALTVMEGSRLTQKYINRFFGREMYPADERPE